MGLFDDLTQFLETRLEEFLREHPELELRALDEQLREQEADARRSLTELQGREQQIKTEIWETAQDVQRWHTRIAKVEAAGETALAAAAREREAALLRQGNQLWGQMQGIRARIQTLDDLVGQVVARRQEVSARAAAAQASTSRAANPNRSQAWSTTGDRTGAGPDSLEEQFRRWEMDDELDQLKRQMGRS
ncbi:MAG: TIGR04376 family protein [Oscillatoriales cyanobacterium]|nr:MAG: TIGR04376 family protein [Oscillatoriales cyanobacterium]